VTSVASDIVSALKTSLNDVLSLPLQIPRFELPVDPFGDTVGFGPWTLIPRFRARRTYRWDGWPNGRQPADPGEPGRVSCSPRRRTRPTPGVAEAMNAGKRIQTGTQVTIEQHVDEC